MAAKVGSVFVDVIANTAEFQAGMKRAADATRGLDGLVSEKAYKAAHAQDRAAGAARRHADAADGATRALLGQSAALAAQLGISNPVVSTLVRMADTVATLNARVAGSTSAMTSAAASAKGLASSLAPLAAAGAKVALVAAGSWGWKTAFDAIQREIAIRRSMVDGTAEYAKTREDWLKSYAVWLKESETGTDAIIKRFAAGKVTFDEAKESIRQLAEVDVSAKVGDWIDRRSMTEAERSVQNIADEFAKVRAEAEQIGDRTERMVALSRLTFLQTAEVAALHRRELADQLAESEKARADQAERTAKAAKEIAEAMGRAAGLTIGRGADAWKAVAEAERSQRVVRIQDQLTSRFGGGTTSGDERQTRILEEMRDYLKSLANAETVPL